MELWRVELWRVELWRVELWRVVLLVWLWTSAGGQEPETVSCVVMETCVLPCSSDGGEIDLIRWLKTEEDLLVHLSQDGTDQLHKQAESFRGRTSLFPEQISRGNASLQLSHVKVSDQGKYLCQTFTSNSGAKTWVQLRVKAEGPGAPAAVIGGSVCGALVLLLVVFFFFFLWKRQKDKEPQNRAAEEQETLLEERGGPAALELMLQETFGALSEEESLKFMSFLEDQSLMGEFSVLHRNDVEKDDLVKSMVHVYGVHSITVTHRLLQKLQRKDLLKKLSQWKCDPEERRMNLLHCVDEKNNHLEEEKQEKLRGGPEVKQEELGGGPEVKQEELGGGPEVKQEELGGGPEVKQEELGGGPEVKEIVSGRGLSHSCGPQASVLSSSSPTDQDLSHNHLKDSGEETLCPGQKSAPCTQETPRLDPAGQVQMFSKNSLSAEKKQNQSHCLNKMNHLSLEEEIQENMRGGAVVKASSKEMLDPAGDIQMVSDLRKYSCEFSLDPNTAHRRLLLSEDNRTVTNVKKIQKYPHHQDRFTGQQHQVLSSTGLRGRCYWEVEWRGKWVRIAVSYRRIRRRGDDCVFGHNDLSWSLEIDKGMCFSHHNTERTRLCDWLSSSGGVSSGRVGVFLDSEAGALSFYKVVSDRRVSHIHTFSSSFSEPLFPGFGLFAEGDSVSVVDLSTNRGQSS